MFAEGGQYLYVHGESSDLFGLDKESREMCVLFVFQVLFCNLSTLVD